ncbi:hypothetical protein QBZ16_003472 [Prototheca wickerhamii]|uniref:Uncharacterized protein n=1 Tax=Prototheca wickerhamii TaxID=3111 RepID=A0AAD9MIL9_PROWI|nr:hypothetical protein QBZ16_003472 [Prototheca wickerhamii]
MAGQDRVRAEDFARFKQYDYAANSNLVLTAEQRTSASQEPDGAAETLWGRMKGRMGDRASVLDAETAGLYRPRTEESRVAFEALLSIVAGVLGGQEEGVLLGAADEVLATLKNDRLTDPQRQAELGALLGAAIPDERFAVLVELGKRMQDWTPEGEADPDAGAALDEEGVAVEFDDESDEEDEEGGGGGFLDAIAEEDEEEGEEGEEEEDARRAVRAGGDAADAGAAGAAPGGAIPLQEIDAYWLQRRVSRALPALDAPAAQRLAEELLAALAVPDAREAENRAVALLGFDAFDAVKELLRNRHAIVWCMRLARAPSDEARAALEREMAGADAEVQGVLRALRATRLSARERQEAVERGIREEARRLRDGDNGNAGAGEDAAAPASVSDSAAAAQPKQLDLDALAFTGGGHFNSNCRPAAPAGSYRTVHKGYEEVHVPAPAPPEFAPGERLVEIASLPAWARDGFRGMKALNRVQSRVMDAALFSAENMLICAPTGAGKTNVAVLAMLHTIGSHRRADGSVDTAAFKMIYVAPMKALVAEMVGNFSKRLEPYGVKVRELTGDVSLTGQEIAETQLIVVTPEKWDVVTRNAADRAYTKLVRLVIIDEIHLLHDERGPVLESIVARTLRQVETTQQQTRIVGLSATLPNYRDVAAFLRVDEQKGLFYFDASYRPCPLAQQYVGVTAKKPLQRYQAMNELAYAKLMEAAGKHQVLVFVHSRKETAKTASFLKDEALKNDALTKILRDDSASREILQTEAAGAKSLELKELLPFGFGIHHAGLSRADRTLVEDLFSDGHIQVLVSTATLAWGVNLPAHTVIIKGTQVYSPAKGAWVELSPLDVVQMFGRAGRPQYDTFGEGIILTTHAELAFYVSLFNTQLPVESQFVGTLPDNLNAEVVLNNVGSLRDAAAWLGYTFYYVRALCSPALYGIPHDEAERDPELLQRRLDLAHSAATLLARRGLIRYDRRTGALSATELGRVAARYYVSSRTVATFNDALRPSMTEIELLRLFAAADEFQHTVVRADEKLELARLLDRVPIPIKESVDEPAAKVNALLQAHVSHLTLDGLALSADMVQVVGSAARLLRCLYEVCLRRGWAALAERALSLTKCVQARMWSSQTPLRQFAGVPADILARIERKELPWERWYDLSSQEIGELLRLPKMGKAIHRLVHQFPRYELGAHVNPISRGLLQVDLTITADFRWEEAVHGPSQQLIILVEDSDGERILHHETFILKRAVAEEDQLISFTLPIAEPLPPQYFVKVVSDKWVGCEAVLPISFRHLILPSKYPPPTELLDLQPLPLSALRDERYEKLYADAITFFNPIQTQCFAALYGGDANVLLCAPVGSGKTVCAELAVLRALKSAEPGARARVVYVHALDEVVDARFARWRRLFGEGLNLTVERLVGETAADLKALERSDVRRAVQAVTLLVVDDLHLLGGARGPALEIVCSRARYVAGALGRGARILGLAAPIANARRGRLAGRGRAGAVQLPPGARPAPLEVRVQGFDAAGLEARMAAMARPAYQAIAARTDAQALVFVPSRRYARMAALDLITFAAADGTPYLLRREATGNVGGGVDGADPSSAADQSSSVQSLPDGDLAPYLARMSDAALAHAARHGVVRPPPRAAAEALYGSGAARVLVATSADAWRLGETLGAGTDLVVVWGTQAFDAGSVSGTGAAADYPVTDVLQMVAAAGRGGARAGAAPGALLLCASPRKEYYKKFLTEPLPVDSHLDAALHDALCAEVVAKTITSKQDAVDYLTWTLYYRRLTANPNFYGMTGTTHRHISDHLSDLVERVLSDLEAARMIAIEDEVDLEPLNLGMIASYYYVAYTTLELMAAWLGAKTKLAALVEVVSAASEFDAVPVRPGEERLVERLLAHAPLAVSRPRFTDPHTKIDALLQAHFARSELAIDLDADRRAAVPQAVKLVQACVDVLSSGGWLAPALAAMELSQMLVQARWQRDSPLTQLPHVDAALARRCADAGVETVFGLLEMEDGARRQLLALPDRALGDIARWCNRYPDISREGDAAQALGPVIAPHYPARKEEAWWLVVGDVAANTLLAIKRVPLQYKSRVKLDFVAPSAAGPANLTLFFMCDSYMGCDQEFQLELEVLPGEEEAVEEQAEPAADDMQAE